MKIKRLIFPDNKSSIKTTNNMRIDGSSSKFNFSNKFKFPRLKINFKWLFIVLAILFVLFAATGVAGYFFVVKPVLAIVEDAKKVEDSTYAITQGLKNLNLQEIKGGLKNTDKELASFKTKLEKNSSLLRKLPKGEIYYQDANHLIAAVEETISLGNLTVDIIEPYSEDLGLATDGNKAIVVPAQERIIKFMRLMPQFSPKVKEISDRVQKISDEIAKIDAKNYPTKLPWIVSKFGVDPETNIRSQILDVQSITYEIAQKAPQFEAFFNAIPEFMGLNTPKKYMILMANNYELRMSGGFNTYIIMAEFDAGIPKITYSIDTYFIDEGDRTGSSGMVNRNVPYHLRNYLYLSGNTFRWYARDATSNSADFPYAADDLLYSFWKKDRSLPQDISGVIQINNDVAVDILRAVGPVNTSKYSIRRDDGSYTTIPTTEFNADNVIDELETIAGGKLAQTIGRKEIIKFLADSIMTKIYTSEATNLVHITRVFLESMSKKDILMYSFDPVVQKAFEDLGYGGRVVAEPQGADYLHVNRSNYGAGKADWTKEGFVTQEVQKSVNVVDGKKISTVKVKIKNPKRPSWYNIDPCCFYNAYMRVYVPKGSKMISVTADDGQDAKGAEYIDERVNKTYIESFTRQLKETDLTITYVYELPDTVDLDNYKLLLQRQSGTTIDPYQISVNGISKDVLLNTDKLLEIK